MRKRGDDPFAGFLVPRFSFGIVTAGGGDWVSSQPATSEHYGQMFAGCLELLPPARCLR